LKLLSEELTERLQRLSAVRFRQRFPESFQRDLLRRRLRRDKKAPSWSDRMAFLHEQNYDKFEASRRASKERKVKVPESRRRVDTG
jgi:hypothetical protein